MSQVQPRVVLCVLHDDANVVRELCSRFSGFEYDEEYSGCGADDRMLRSFLISDQATLGPEDLAAVREHRDVSYVLSPPLARGTALTEGVRALTLVVESFQAGARAIKCESSGLTHGRERWLELARRAGQGEHRAGALYHALVRRPIAGQGVIYSCGMHLLGYPDVEVCAESVSVALEAIDGFAFYLLIDQPDKIQSGQTFALSKQAPVFIIERVPCSRYASDDFFFNPYGYWRLSPNPSTTMKIPIQ